MQPGYLGVGSGEARAVVVWGGEEEFGGIGWDELGWDDMS